MRRPASFAEIEAEFIERARRMVWCNVATLDRQNRPRSRILHPIWAGAIGGITCRPDSLHITPLRIRLNSALNPAENMIWQAGERGAKRSRP